MFTSRHKANRLAGHTLPREGRLPGNRQAGATQCSCGTHSPELPSTGARRRWHRDHKEAVRAADTARRAVRDSLARLAREGRSLGVFLDSILVATAPADDPYGDATVAEAATRTGRAHGDFVVLALCPDHPDTAAVDCVTCYPL